MRPWVMQGNKEHEMVVQEEALVGLGSENVSFPPPKVPPIRYYKEVSVLQNK
jgi:hypothetical protein